MYIVKKNLTGSYSSVLVMTTLKLALIRCAARVSVHISMFVRVILLSLVILKFCCLLLLMVKDVWVLNTNRSSH